MTLGESESSDLAVAFSLFSDTAKGYLVGQIMLDHGEGSSDLPRNKIWGATEAPRWR